MKRPIQMVALHRCKIQKYPKNTPPKHIHNKNINVEKANCNPKEALGNCFCMHPKPIQFNTTKIKNIIGLYLDLVWNKKQENNYLPAWVQFGEYKNRWCQRSK